MARPDPEKDRNRGVTINLNTRKERKDSREKNKESSIRPLSHSPDRNRVCRAGSPGGGIGNRTCAGDRRILGKYCRPQLVSES